MKKVKYISIILFLVLGLLWLYASSLIGVNEKAKQYLITLKQELKKDDLSPSIYVISGRRWKLDNYLLNKLSGAASRSQHLVGNAIDIIVLDVNQDGTANKKDVDLVYNILNERIIKNKGGIGTYKNENEFFSRQMIHFDCRGVSARWNR